MDFLLFVMWKCMSTSVRVNGIVELAFLLVMRLNIIIVTWYFTYYNTCILIFPLLNLENGPKKHVRRNKICIFQISCDVMWFHLLQRISIKTNEKIEISKASDIDRLSASLLRNGAEILSRPSLHQNQKSSYLYKKQGKTKISTLFLVFEFKILRNDIFIFAFPLIQ